jgi:hypothetical protein
MEVELLFEAAERSFPMLDRPALELQSAPSVPEPTAVSGLLGTTLSHYRLLSRLGRGGMGSCTGRWTHVWDEKLH